MLVNITQSCSVKLNGEVKTLREGMSVTLPTDKAQRIIDAGYASLSKTDIEAYHNLFNDISQLDTQGGCWDWITATQPELWKQHMRALLDSDIATTRLTFNEMVTLWKEHSDSQPIVST